MRGGNIKSCRAFFETFGGKCACKNVSFKVIPAYLINRDEIIL
jgi:hypothetical protein